MFYWIYDYSTGSVGLAFGVAFVVVTWAGILLFRPLVRRWVHRKRSVNDLIGFFLSAFSMIYGILLGLLAVATYQSYSVADDIVAKEATSLAALYRDFGGYPSPMRETLQGSLRNYTLEVVNVSWPKQRLGEIPTRETELIREIFDKLLTFNPGDRREEAVFGETLRQFNQLIEHRRARLDAIGNGIPSILWWVVMIGALFHIILLWLLDMELHAHLLLSGLLACFIGILIFLIAELDHPFRGHVSTGPEPLRLVLETTMDR